MKKHAAAVMDFSFENPEINILKQIIWFAARMN